MHAVCLVCALSYKSPSGESFTNKARGEYNINSKRCQADLLNLQCL